MNTSTQGDSLSLVVIHPLSDRHTILSRQMRGRERFGMWGNLAGINHVGIYPRKRRERARRLVYAHVGGRRRRRRESGMAIIKACCRRHRRPRVLILRPASVWQAAQASPLLLVLAPLVIDLQVEQMEKASSALGETIVRAGDTGAHAREIDNSGSPSIRARTAELQTPRRLIGGLSGTM